MSSNQGGRTSLRLVCVAAAVVAAIAYVVPSVSAHGVTRQRSLARAAVAAVAKPPANPLPAAGKVLGGLTSQRQAVVLAIAKKDKQVTQVVTSLNMKCTTGDQFFVPDGWAKLPIAHNGAVKVGVTIPSDTSTGGTITGGTDTFTGKLNAKKATFSGKWELKLDFSMTDSTGATVTDQCDSGPVTFKAVL